MNRLTSIILLTLVTALMSGASNFNVIGDYNPGTAFTHVQNFRVNQSISTKAYVSRLNLMRIQDAKKTEMILRLLEDNKPLVFMLNYYGYKIVYRDCSLWPKEFNNHRIYNLQECVSLKRYCRHKN